MLKMVLEEDFAVVETAADGVEGLEKFEKSPFDLVLIDQLMPHRNGTEVTRDIRAKFPQTKIILMSASAHAFQNEAIQAGADHVLAKPFLLSNLYQLIDNLFPSVEKAPRERRTILLVDDDERVLLYHTGILENDFNIVAAASGAKALEEVSKNPDIGVVLLDISMPEMDGVQTLEKLKSLDPYLQVIMVTVHDSISLYSECLKKGAFGYIVKPANREKLYPYLDRALERRQIAKKEITKALKGKVLLIDPIPAFVSAVSMVMGNEFEFKAVQTIADALKIMELESFRIIIINMDEYSKEEIRKVKEKGRTTRFIHVYNTAVPPEAAKDAAEILAISKKAGKLEENLTSLARTAAIWMDVFGKHALDKGKI